MAHGQLTLGIDLSVDDGKTAVCAVLWQGGAGTITELSSGWTNAALRELIAGADWCGIDTPFSWPVRFRDALAGHFERGGWPYDYRSPDYQFRSTDRFVAEIACRPLSVSTNLLGITAMRCARLLQEIGEERGKRLSLTGDDHIVDIYPAASLTAWGGTAAGFNPKGYKNGPAAREARELLVQSFVSATFDWLDLTSEHREKCADNDDVLDALIAALTTRAAQFGLTHQPNTDAQCALGEIEGWIHVPKPGTLSLLGGAAPNAG